MTENPDEFELEDEALELASGGSYALTTNSIGVSIPPPPAPSPLPTDPGFTSIISEPPPPPSKFH